jgi:hypothetical protein
MRNAFLHQAQRADHLAVMRFQPEVPRLGEQVPPVQLRIRDGLFDDEHLHPQLEQLVKSLRIKVFGPHPTKCFRHDTSNFNIFDPHVHTSSNNAGSSDSLAPSDGTISLSIGCHV